ncbi:MAG: hypothetical protein R3A48_08175 [Polyangiales bacterium]
MASGRLLRWLHRDAAPRWGVDPHELDPDALRVTLAKAARLFRVGGYFDLDLGGWERLPPAPALLVSNHSGGTSIPDVWGFGVGWYLRHGLARPLHPLAHEIILSTPATARYFGRRGVLRARPETAWRALVEARRDVLVLPGGDRDTWRPFSRRWEVEFAGRVGYAKLALRAGAPVVPVAHAGAHETLVVLSDGSRLARAVGLHGLVRAEIWPVHLSLPWGLAFGPWPHIPLPARMSYRFGPPIDPREYGGPTERPSERAVRALDAAVRGSIQSMLAELRAERAGGRAL